MRLKNASRLFDKTVFTDAYGTVTFKGQLDPFDFFKLDGAAVKRRALSTAPGVTIPARRTIKADDQVYLVGDQTPDHWAGSKIRNRYVLHGADYLAQVRTVAEALADAAGLTAWVSRDWNKDTTDSRVSAENISQYHMFFSSAEDVPDESVLTLSDGRNYLVQGTHRALSGFTDALANEIPEPVFETVSFADRTYDPVADSFSSVTNNVRVMRIRWQEAFQYLSRASVEFERGDCLVFIPKGIVSPSANDTVPLSDGTWRVVSSIDNGTFYRVHLRRV